MSSLHPARRSAERFNSLLQGEQGVPSTRDAQLLELVSALQTAPRAEARAEFVSDLRERLMLAAETELVPDSPAALDGMLTDRLTVRTNRTPRERRLAIALGGFAIVGATTSMAVAAQTALPGDVLYPLKRAIENAETGFSVSDEAKGNTILENASGRLDEVDQLTRGGDADAADVTATLQTFADQASEASELLIADYQTTGSESSINDLRDFTSSSIETLANLEAYIPAEAEGALQDAAYVLFQIDSLAGDLCPVCDSLGIVTIPPALMASGGPKLDAAQIAATEPTVTTPPTKPGKPGTGKGKKPPITVDDPSVTSTSPIQLPTESTTNGPGNGDGSKPPKTPGASISVSVPPIGVPAVDQVIDDVVQGVDDVLGGLSGQN
jgi:hypothetical protein